MLSKRRLLIAIGGGIAAYKVCEVISRLFQAGVEVRVILSDRATAFITPLTVSTLSRHPVYLDTDFWQPIHSRPLHIELGEWAELILLAPLTANTLAKLTHGFADNLLTNTVLASRCPILVAPAMNTEMWEQETVQRNWQQLLQLSRYHGLTPGAGLLACDRVGVGRLAEPGEIIAAIESLLYTGGKRDLIGKHLLITTGGTREHLDPVRYIGNPATGKMGIALARAGLDRGATVTLIHTSTEAISLPCHTLRVTSAAEMTQAVLERAPVADWIIMAAAVADVKPTEYSPQKLPKNALPRALPLTPVPDILTQLSANKKPQQRLIGFAAQTGDIIPPAREKLTRKNLDVIVANPIDIPGSGFGSDTNQGVFLDAWGRQENIPPCAKLELAHRLFDFVDH